MRISERIDTIDFPTAIGKFDLEAYKTKDSKQPEMKYVLLLISKKGLGNPVNVRIHSECLLSEVFKSTHCDCREQMEFSMNYINRHGGILFYLNQEGRGHGLLTKIMELKLQENGFDTVAASEELHLNVDARDYTVVGEILKDKGIKHINLLTNNPKKIDSLKEMGISVDTRIPVEVKPNKHNIKYLRTKKLKLSHLFNEYI